MGWCRALEDCRAGCASQSLRHGMVRVGWTVRAGRNPGAKLSHYDSSFCDTAGCPLVGRVILRYGRSASAERFVPPTQLSNTRHPPWPSSRHRLGTTNSVGRFSRSGEPVVIPNSEGARTTQRVAFSKAGEVLVGEVAKRQAITNPDRTSAASSARWVRPGRGDIDGKRYTAQRDQRTHLDEAQARCRAYCGDTVTRPSSPCPRTSHAQRTATKEAGQIAGLECSASSTSRQRALATASTGHRRRNHPRVRPRCGTFDVSVLRSRWCVRGQEHHGDTTSVATIGTSASSTGSSSSSSPPMAWT